MKELYSQLSLKRLFKGLFFIVFFFLISNSLWSQTYNLRFEKVSNNGTTLVVKVQMSLSSAENLGTSNLVFTYDGAEMNTPTLGTIHNFSGGNYQTMTLTSPATNTVSLNIELNTDDAGTALATGASFTDVAEISFTLPDETGTANFQWQEATTTKTVVYQDDNATLLAKGTLTNNDLSLDATAPSTPGTPDLATSSDSGSEEATAGATSDNLTNDLTPTFEGTGVEANATIKVTSSVDGLLGSVAANGSGVWSFTPGSNMSTGSHNITATATDAASNESSASSALSITIDTTQPTVAVTTTSTDPTNDNPIPVTITFNEEADGFKETDITVTNATTGDFASADSTTFTVNLTPSGDGAVTVDVNTAVATDQAGNNNTAASQLSLTYDGTGPTVTSVSSSTANGTFGVGDDIVVTVTFSENVTVVGTPQLTLETGGTDRTINYNGTGSGTNTLQFNYTVQAGDVSTDLDYVATNSLTAGTSIKDALGNDANLTLPTPGAANSLGSNKNLVLDTAAPTVSSSSPADDDTGVDPSANITVTFNEDIEFGTGNIQLKQTSDDGVVFSIDAADPTATSNVASISGAVLTINPGTDLSTSTGYYLSIPNTAIDDLVGNDFAGITNTTDRNFTTIVPNSAPSFTIGANQTVSQSAGAQTIPSHSTGMTDNDGATQTLTFNVANDNNGIFDVQPDIDESSGNLTFTPKSSTFGKATVTVSLSDDGGTASGGVDQSANQTFDIFITPDNIKINEVHASAGADAEFIEVYNTGAGATSLSGLVMVWFNGNDDLAYKDFDLTGSTSASGFYVIGETAFGSKDQDWGATDLQNGPDAVAIYVGSASDFTGASAPTTDGLVDVIVYGSTDDAALRTALGNPALQVAGSSTNSISRSPDGTGAFVAQAATPQATNDVTAPTVTSVSSSTADGTLKTNDCAIITVTFSEAVTVVGFPTLKMETGTTDQTINPNGFPFGSGTTTLEFLYCVGAGESSSDLEYFDINSLTAGTSIQDAAGNDAVLTLPTIGGGNSLSDNKALVIDGVAPTVTSVTSTASTGAYKEGDVIPITVTFSEAVTVTGTPQIELETGTTDRTVNYSSGSGTTTLTFNYTVQAGDTNGGGVDYTSTSALTLNSGTINDPAGNAATLTLATVGAAGSISNTKSITIDTTAPTVTSVSSSTADGSYNAGDVIAVTVTFSEAVTVTGTPQLTLETGTTDRTVNYSSGSGTTTLTFDYTVQAGDTNADLDYVATNSLALNSGTINDDADNAATLTLATPAAANSLGSNKDLVIDTTAPTVTSVSSTFVSGSYKAGVVIPITVTFSEAVTVTGTPQITLETGTTDRTVNYTSGSGTTLLSFNYTVQAGDVSTDLDYVATNSLALNSGTINDAAGNAATLTLATPAATNSLGDSKDIVIDTTAPTVTGVSSSTADGSYKAGDVIAVTVTFSENVNVTGTPQITLETGTTDRTVNYSSGSGGTTLTFNYTVQAGDESADLDYVATNSLALNSGTINDAASNAATLTLASPAATNSLGANKGLVIDTAVPTLSSVGTASSQTAAEVFVDGSHATTGNTITISFTASEALNANPTVSMSVGGTGVSPTINNLGSNNYSATYTILGTENEGAVTFTIDFTDAAGNAGTQVTAVTNSSSVEADFNAPALSSVTLSTNNSTDNQHGTTGDVVTLAFTANDDLSANPTVSMSVGGTGVTPTVNDLGSNNYSATYTLLGSENEGAVTFTIDFVDDAGLSGTQVTATTDASSVEADFNAPTLTTVTLVSSQTAAEQFVDASHASNGNTVTLDIVSSDVLSALPTVAIQSGGVNVQGPVTVAHDNPGAPDFQNFNVTYQVDGSGTTNGVDKDADGTVTFTIDFTDDVGIVGTQVTATTNSSAVEVDNVAPTLTSVAIASSQTASEAFADASHATTGNLVTVSFTSDDDLSANPVVSMSVGGTGVTPAVNDLGSNNYSATYTILGTENDGAVTFTIDFTDDAGNAGTQVTAVTNSSSVEVDFVVPTLSPVTLSTNNSTDNQHGTTGDVVTLAFTANDDLSANPTVSMSVGGSVVTPTVNTGSAPNYTATYTLLGTENEGAVTFTIDFVDDAGISGTQVTATTDASSVEADFNAPTLTTVTLISDNGTNTQQATGGNTVLLDIVSSDVLSALPTVVIQSGGVNVQGPVTVAHDNPGAPDFQNFNVTYVVDGTGTTAGVDKDGEGALTFTIDFTDDAGIAGTQVTATTNSSTMNIDYTAPSGYTITIDQSPINAGNAGSASFTFAGAEIGASFNYTVTTSGGAATLTSGGTISTGTDQVTIPGGVSGFQDGTITVSVTLTDTNGNTGIAATDTETKDTVAPVISEVTAVTTPGNDNTPDYVFTSNETGTFAVGGSAGTSTSTTISSTGNQTITFTQTDNSTALADGDYTNVTITATDAAGNSSTALAVTNFTIDTSVPVNPVVTTPSAATNVNAATATISGTHAEDGVVVHAYADADNNGTADNATSLGNGTVSGGNWGFSVNLTADAANNFVVQAQDGGGNVSGDVDVPTIAEDSQNPIVNSTSPSDDATDVGITSDITITFNEDIQFGTGGIQIIDITDGSNSIVIDAGSPGSQASISGSVLTLNPTNSLDLNSDYAIAIGATAIDDLAGNDFAGILNTTVFNFTTVATTVAFSSTSSSGAESTSSADLEVTLNAISGVNVTVDYAVTGTASGSGTDYTLANGTLTINAGSLTNNITIASIIDDALDEAEETVIVTLSNPTNAGLGTNQVHTYTINDDDPTPTVAFSATNSSAAESTTSADLQVALSAVSGQDVMVDYTVTGTATGSGTDYTLANGTLTISAGDANKNITIASIVGDVLDEADETVIVTLSNPQNATLGTNTAHTYTILDDDATPTVAFSATSSSAAESTTSANLTVDLSAVSGQTVTVDYTVSGTATGSGTDYTLADGQLTFNAGSSQETITIASIIGDVLDEDDETVIVTLSSPTNATLGTNTVHTYTILDDDATPTISFTTASSNGAESVSSKDVQVDLSAVSGRAITADYTVTGTASNGTDYTLADGALTFTAGDNSETITIASIDDDAILESNETVIITLSNLVNVGAGTNQQFTYTIFDNDAAAVTIADVSQAENGGDITVTATLDNAVEGGFTVDVNTADGTAETTDSDYTAVTSETLTFTGTAGEMQTFTVTPTADTKLEADETLTVSMDNLAATSLSVDISDGATVTINNDDNAAVTIEDVTGTENGGAILLTATLDNAVQGGFSVDVITTDNTATTADSDYTALNVTTLNFTGNAGETQQFTLTPTADTKVEANEDLFIGMQNTQGTSHSINIGDGASVTIINDDAATIAINDVTRAENADGGATTTYTFTATLTGDVDQSISVDYATQDGTATTADNDYTAASGTLTFDGINGETETFQVIVGNDDKVELDETFSALLSNRQVGGKNVTLSDASGTGTITNDDAAAVTIADVSGAENGGDITVTATLDKAVEGGFTVDVSTADGTAETGDSDYTAVTSETLTFAGTVGETQTFTVSPTADTKFETDETLTVAMSNLVAVNAAVSAIDITDGATVTIDNDDTEPTVTLSVDNNSIAENGGTATLTATLSNLSVNNVDVTIAYGGTADNGTDYNNTASTTITVSAGTISASAAVIITATDDATAEGDETIITTIDGVTNGTEDGTQSQTITIEDDDAAIITSVTSNTVNGSYKAGDLIEVLVTFNRAVNVTGTPQLTLETGTTDQTADYTSGDGTTTLTFNYTVQMGDVSSDLDYTGTTALALNGGTIIGNGLNAILDLPAPGATNSLGDNAAIVIDTDAPTDPVVTVPATDILLNAATQTVSGTHGEDGVTINLYADSDNNGVADNATVLTSATVSGNAWSLTANLTGDAANNFVVQAVDAAGNSSAQVDVPTITEDSISPVITSDGGAATASLNVNENNTAVTTVTATDANAVTFTISGGADQALFSMASGVLTFTAAPDFENPGDADTDNAYVVEVTASDGVNTDDTQTITVTVVDLDDNSPVITSDGGAATAALNVNENTTAVTTVTASDADGVSTVVYSISGGADQALFSMASGELTFTAAPDFENPGDADTDNAYVVEVTATDGNTTADTQTITVTVVDLNDNTPVITASQVFNIDETAANSTPVGTVVATDQDAGTTFSSWAITAGNGAGIFAVNATTGAVTVSDNTNLSAKDITASYTLTLTVSDGANTSATETVTVNILDTTAPSAPVVTGISDDTGSSSTDGITSDRNLLVHGTAEANANVEIFSGAASVGTVQADANGDWTLDITGFTLNENVSNVTAEAEDASGNRSTASAVFVLIIDFTAPAKPAVTHISDDTGSSSTDGITSDRNILVHGTAEANSSVEVFSGAVSVGSVQTDGNGDWTLDITGFTLTNRVSNVTAEAEDVAGNRSVTSDIFVLTIDFSAPAKPVISSISDDTGSSATDGITNDKTLSFIGTAEANSTVEVFIDGTSIGTTTANGSGDFTFDHTGTSLAEGTMAVTARASDTAGNQSVASDAFTVTVDATAPAKAILTSISDDLGISNTDFITSDLTLIYNGTAEPLSSVALRAQNIVFVTATADANGDWIADFTNRPIGQPITVTILSTDVAGNTRESDPIVVGYDGIAPTVSSINRADPSPTAATSVDFTVTFDEEVHGLSASNFGLAFTGTQNASIASVSATSGTSVTVTVNNITGGGTFGLNLTSITGITDVAGNDLSGTFTGELYTTNSTPTNISLSSTSILENNAIGDAVGTMSSADIDAGDTHTYTLVSGTGDADNASFSINGTQVEAAAVFDRETKASYNIRLQTDDGNGGTFQKAFTITIDNVPEADLRITGNNNIPATPLGITTSFDITIHNDGDAAMSVTSILYPTAFGGPVSGINIAAASSQVVTMTFTPTVAQLYTGDITIVTNGGTGILSVSADGAIITGTDDGLLTADAINIYPNPASDVVTVDLSEFNGRPLDIQLFDLSGTKTFGMTDFREATLKLDIRAYQQGIYLMYFTDGKSTVQKKFMIRK